MSAPNGDTPAVSAISDGKVRGSWPGGPQRGGAEWVRERPPQLQRVSEIEDRIAVRSMRMKRKARLRRLAWGWAGFSALALVVGAALGLRSRTTAAELAEAQKAMQTRQLDISSEVNRTLLELWKMEDVEYSRNRR